MLQITSMPHQADDNALENLISATLQAATPLSREPALDALRTGVQDYIARIRKRFTANKSKPKNLKQLPRQICQDIERLTKAIVEFEVGIKMGFDDLKYLVEEILDHVIENKVDIGQTGTDFLRLSLIQLNSMLTTYFLDNHASFNVKWAALRDDQMVVSYAIICEEIIDLIGDLSPFAKKIYSSMLAKLKCGAMDGIINYELQNQNLEAAETMILAAQRSGHFASAATHAINLARIWLEQQHEAKHHFWIQKATDCFNHMSNFERLSTPFIAPQLKSKKDEIEEYLKKHYLEMQDYVKKQQKAYKFDITKDAIYLYTRVKLSFKQINIILDRDGGHCKAIEREKGIILQPLSFLSLEFFKKIVNHIVKTEQRENELEVSRLALEFAELATINPVSYTLNSSITHPRIEEPQKNKQSVLTKKMTTSLDSESNKEEKLSDAKRLGFSEEIFGQHPFHQCRMRMHDLLRSYYVVWGGNQGKVVPPLEIEQDFVDCRVPNAKIVPAIGEVGFKWEMRRDKGQEPYLYGKNKSNFRLFPTAREVNKKGEIAFLYGEFHDTKTGVWDDTKVKAISKIL